MGTASSTATGSGFSTTGAINGNYRGPWGNSVEGWNDNTPNVVPDWLQIDFAGSKTIDEISVFSLHDNYTQENTPTETQTFTLYGLLNFDVQYWNGSSWVTVPGGSVTGNNKVWRKFTFSPITTSKIRVNITAVPDSWSRVVEIQAFGTSAGDEKVQWMISDQLGTPRMILDQTGSLVNMKRHDYLPFGEELFAGVSGRNTTQGYAGDGIRQQFTLKERDIETGLDYFLARYYSSTHGRFISPDEFTGGPNELYLFVKDAADNPTFYSEPDNPQSLNKYQYTYNNPLRYTDPDGHCPVCPVAQRIVQSPTGQQLINAAGAAATTTVVVASGALKKAWDWFTTPNPNARGNTVCGMGLDCSGAYTNQYRNQSTQPSDSSNQGQQQGQTQQGQSQSNTPQSSKHDQEKKQEGRSGQDPRRDVGDSNRVIREGKRYTDTATGNIVHVGQKGHTVITDATGKTIVTRNTYTKKQVQARVNDGRWEPQ